MVWCQPQGFAAYSQEVQRAVNQMIAAASDMEFAYAQAAANANTSKVGLANFARYFHSRAREVNEQRNQMMRYHARRCAEAQQQQQQQPQQPQQQPQQQQQQQQPMPTAQAADQIQDIVRHFAQLEKELEESWRKLCALAAEIKDAWSKHFAQRHLAYQHQQAEKATRLCNMAQQMQNMYQMDQTAMKNEVEKEQCCRHHCQGCSYYDYPSEEYSDY